MSENRLGDGEEEAGACMIYECENRYVGVYYAEESVKFFSHGETREDCLDDMLATINHLPTNLHRIENGEASLVDVVPLKRSESNHD